jgi:hypothetical protein
VFVKVPSFDISRIGKGSTTVVTRRRLKSLKTLVGLFCVVSTIAIGAQIPSAQAAAGINPAINFQGKLTNPNGTNIANGSYSFVFSLYSAASGGSAIWTESDSLSLTDGIFQVNLGPSAAGANTNFANVDFNSDSLYLGIKVGADAEMSPRVQFTATPYAFNSGKLGGIAASGFAQINPASAQAGSLNIGSNVQAGTALQAPLVDTATGVALNVGTATATSVTVGRNSSTTPLTLQGSATSTFSGTSAAGTTTVGFTSPTTARSILFPDAGGVICTTVASTCSATYQAAGTFLAKNSADTSAASISAAGYLYQFSNSNATPTTGGVLSLSNGANTGNTLSVAASGNPAAATNALLVVNNTAGSPTGNLLALQAGGANKLIVDATGALTAQNTLTIAAGGATITGNSSITGNLQVTNGADVQKTLTGTSGFSPASNHATTVTPASAPVTVTSYAGITSAVTSTGANINANTTLIGLQGAISNGSTSTLGSATGVNGQIFSANNITSATALNAQIINIGTGNFTSSYGLQATTPVFTSTGTIGTAYGAYVQAQKVAGVTTGYGIYQVGATDLNVFSGATSFTAPGIGLSVTNNATVGGTINLQTISSAANFTGTVTVATSVAAPLLDTASAGILSLGTTNATTINLNQNTVVTTGKSLTAKGNTTVGTAASATLFKNNGATQNNVCAYTGVSGTITLSTAGKTVNDCTAFSITDTGATTISSIASPTAGAGSIIYINNLSASTNPITVLGVQLPVGNTEMLVFDGTNWTTAANAASVKLQDAYNSSAGAAPSILETATNQAVTVQSAFSSGIAAGSELFGVHAAQSGDTLGGSIISATSYGLGINLGTDPASSGLDLQFGGNANRVISVRSATAANQVGGALSVQAGNANGTSTGAAGGVLSLLAGNAAGTGSNAGGAVLIQGGTASSNAIAVGGAVTITGGSAGTVAGSLGGAISIAGGAGSSTGTGAAGNTATLSGGGAGGSGNNAGGSVTVAGGTSTGTGTGGTASLQGGVASSNGAGGSVVISSGAGGATAASGFGAGGNINLQAGSAVGSNNNIGGSISLTAGTRTGTGAPGTVNIGSPVFTSVTQTFTQTSNNQTFPAAGAETTTLQNNLDSYGTIVMNITGAFTGATVNMPSPSNTLSGRVVFVSATSGSVAFTLSAPGMSSVILNSGNTATLVWNGTGWSGTTTASSLQQVYNNTSTSPASIITTSASKNILLQAGVGFDNANVFQIGNSSAAPIISIDTTNTANGFNLASNGGVETSGTLGWTAFAGTGSATISQNVTPVNLASGIGSIDVAITGTGTGGVDNALSSTALASSQLYNVSFNVKASSGVPTIAVQYYRDATPTLDATCSVPTNGTVNSTGFFKYTCSFTTSVVGNTKTTGNFLRITKTDATSIAHIYIDNLAILAQNTTGTKNTANLRVGGPLSQGLTLLTLDTFSGVPFTGTLNQDLYGSLYYDTTLGRIQCYEIDGWGSCGAAPDSNLILEPEYAGAVLNPGLGADTHIGTMTANICSGSTRMSLQPTEGTICASTEEFNFYRWTTSQVSAQTYSIFIKYQLPPTFGGFMDDNTIKMIGRVSSTTDASIAYALFQNNGTQCGGTPAGTTTVTTTANTWQTVSYNGNEATTCSFSPNDIITFRVDLSSKNNAYAYASQINFTMKGK